VVGDGVPEVEHAALSRDHEARAVDGVRLAFEQRLEHGGVFAGIVLQVSVLDDGEFPGGVADSGTDGGALTLVALVAHQADEAGMARGEGFDDLGRAVAGAVIDHDELAREAIGQGGFQHAFEQGGDELLLVEERDEDGKGGPGRVHSPMVPAVE